MESPYFQKDSQGLFYSSTRFYKQFSIYAKEAIECDMIIDLIIKLSSRRKTEVRRRKTISISINRGVFFSNIFRVSISFGKRRTSCIQLLKLGVVPKLWESASVLLFYYLTLLAQLENFFYALFIFSFPIVDES